MLRLFYMMRNRRWRKEDNKHGNHYYIINCINCSSCSFLGFLVLFILNQDETGARSHSILADSSLLARDDEDDGEIHYFDFTTILTATNNFSDVNKLGEGGFGPVYKKEMNNY
uniref:Uncharacterized protein n=1 Tax=Quercus lobata TaxID=97700 RepID=A0A7N2RFA5_QUELO